MTATLDPSTAGTAPGGTAPGADVALVADQLHLAFGGVTALNEVSFQLAAGEVVGLIGPNGAGKTSLMNCLRGFYKPSRGHMWVHGERVSGRSTNFINGQGVARTFQQADSLAGMGSRDVLLLGRERFMPKGFLRYAFGTPSVRAAERDAEAAALVIAEELGVLEFVAANTPYEGLPYGVRKMIDLGRALACEPRVLLMDEPAAGLSPHEKELMIAAIKRIKADRGLTQLLVDHDVDFVSAVSSRLIVLDAGTLIADGPVADVLADPAVIESYIGRPDDGDAATPSPTPDPLEPTA